MRTFPLYLPPEPITAAYALDAAILHNVKWIRAQVAPKKVLAMLKSNAYGHGLVKVAQLIKDKVDAFGVARLEDAIALRSSGISTPTLVMGGVQSAQEIELTSFLDLSLLVHNEAQLETFLKLPLSQPVSVWLKVDLGMNRLGFAPGRASELTRKLSASRNVKGAVKVIGHFSNADQKGSIRTLVQKWKFDELTHSLKIERSLSNSAAIVTDSAIPEEWVRTGLLLYGVSPVPGRTGEQIGLKPAMNFDSKLVEIRDCRQGSLVSYLGNWKSPSDHTRIGVVGAGYGDGMPRLVGPGASVLIRGQQCPIVGNVCMNMFMVDLTAHPEIENGDYVRIWGDGQPVERMAAWANTIPNQLLVGVH